IMLHNVSGERGKPKHSDLGLSLTLEASSIDQFALERGKEALGHGVVETVTDRSHRRSYTHLATARAEGDRSVLSPLVGMMDDLAGSALCIGHFQRLQHQLTAQMILHRPPDHTTTEGIDHHSQMQEAGPGRNVGD